ncbi:hypothetical protein ACWGJT_00070 [Streptomyces xantholiticus]
MRRTPGLDGRALVIETLHLAGLYVDCGLPQQGAELVRRTMADALAVLADDPEGLPSAQAVAAENMSLARTVSQQQMAMGRAIPGQPMPTQPMPLPGHYPQQCPQQGFGPPRY